LDAAGIPKEFSWYVTELPRCQPRQSSSQSIVPGSRAAVSPLYQAFSLHVLLFSCAGRYQANPANAVFQFFHNEEVRMLTFRRQLQQQRCCLAHLCGMLLLHDQHTVYQQQQQRFSTVYQPVQ
jgi:hypothetical protein